MDKYKAVCAHYNIPFYFFTNNEEIAEGGAEGEVCCRGMNSKCFKSKGCGEQGLKSLKNLTKDKVLIGKDLYKLECTNRKDPVYFEAD